MFRWTAVTVLLILSLIIVLTSAKKGRHVWKKEEIPNMPIASPAECGRKTVGSICDPNGIINETDYAKIDKAAEELRQLTLCDCINKTQCAGQSDPKLKHLQHGYSVGVAIVKQMYIYSNEKPTDVQLTKSAQLFAEHLLRQWKLGQCDDDILIFISDVDNRFYTVVGETTGRKLNYALLQDLYVDHRNDFINKNYADGLVKVINSYRDTLMRLEKPANTGIPAWAILIIVGILVIFGVIVAIVFLRQGLKEKRRRKATRDKLADEKVAEVTEPLAGTSHLHNSSYEAKSEDGQQL